MVSISTMVIDNTQMSQKLRKILKAAKKGVKLAAAEGTQWIRQDVFLGQNYVGSANYPDVTPVTKKIKAKAGKQLVGIWTGNLFSSFIASSSGLEGKITGAGYVDFLTRWDIEALYMAEHAEKTKEIIEKEVKSAL